MAFTGTNPCDALLRPDLGSTTGSIKTSDVTLYDGSPLGCIALPGTPTLNQTLSAIATYICDLSIPEFSSEITYDGAAIDNYTPTGGTGLNAYFEGIDDKFATITASIPSNTSEITYDGVAAVNYTPSGGTLTNANIEGIDAELGIIKNTYTTISILGTMLSEFILDYVEAGAGITAGGGSLDVDIAAGIYYTAGLRTAKGSPETLSLVASSDNYIDINSAGTFIQSFVPLGNPPPVVTGQRLYKCVTDGVGVTGTTDLRNIYPFDGADILTDSILKEKIPDNEIPSAKLTILIGAGETEMANVTVDTAGRITAMDSDFNITGPVNNEILIYNNATSKWINSATYPGAVPSGNEHETIRYDAAGDPVATAFLYNTNSAVMIGTSETPTQFVLEEAYAMSILLAIPTGVAAAAVGGGALPADTYYYVVTALEGVGETIASAEVDETVDGAATTQIDISWSAVTGAVTYRVYKGTATGVYTEYFTVTHPTVSYSDTGAGGVGGSPPADHTALITKISSETDGWMMGGDFGFGITNPTTRVHIVGANEFRYVDGNEGLNKVLVSDANGVASWSASLGIYEVGVGTHSSQLIGDGSSDASADYSVVLGGANSVVTAGSDYSVIVGGNNNLIDADSYNFIGNGSNCDIDTSAGGYNTIVTGNANKIEDGNYNLIVSGLTNTFTGAGDANIIVGGSGISISGAGNYNVIINGDTNLIADTAISHNFIGTGLNCDIDASAKSYNFIGSGNANKIEDGDYNFIGTGTQNTIDADAEDYNTIGNGVLNNINQGFYNTIINGDSQVITERIDGASADVAFSTILSGFHGIADRDHVVVQSAGLAASIQKGSVQGCTMLIKGRTIAADAVELDVYDTGSFIYLKDDSALTFTIHVIGVRTGGTSGAGNVGDIFSKIIVGGIHKIGANVAAMIGGVSLLETNSDASLAGCVITADGAGVTPGRLRIQAEGVPDMNIDWVAHVRFVETRW